MSNKKLNLEIIGPLYGFIVTSKHKAKGTCTYLVDSIQIKYVVTHLQTVRRTKSNMPPKLKIHKNTR